MDNELTQDATQVQGSLEQGALDHLEEEDKKAPVAWGKAVCISPADHDGGEFPDVVFFDDEVTFGRASKCTIHINKPAVSGTHCRIKREHDCVSLTDCSTNGTYVNMNVKGAKLIHLHKDKENSFRVITNGDTICVLRTAALKIIYASTNSEDKVENGVTEKFQTLKKLGSGTFATVNEVMDRATKEKFAMKVIDINKFKESNGSLREDALDTEVDVMKRLDHPNIVKYHWHLKTEKNLYVVLELVKGGDLFDAIVDHGKGFNEDVSRNIFIQLVRAVDYLHKNGVVHRDIKPENILLSSNIPSQSMEVKLADFGLSRAVNTSNKALTICGTWQYLAPEVYDDSKDGYGPEVDTWSCGVVLYILLSGTQPFGEGNNGRNSNLVEQIKKAQFTFPSAQWGMISTGAKEMIKKILKAEPSQRMTLSQIMQDPWFKQGLSHPSPSTAMDTSLSLPDPHPAFSPPKNNHAHSIHLACSSSMDQSVSNGQLATTSSLRQIDPPSLPAQQQQQQQHASKRAKHSDTGNVDFSAFMADQDTTTPTEYKVPGEHGGSGNKRKR